MISLVTESAMNAGEISADLKSLRSSRKTRTNNNTERMPISPNVLGIHNNLAACKQL